MFLRPSTVRDARNVVPDQLALYLAPVYGSGLDMAHLGIAL